MTELTFFSSHKPALPAGTYTVKVGQRLKVPTPRSSGTADQLDLVLGDLAEDAPLVFEASGPRVTLPPDLVGTRYPSPGSKGRYGGTLPHVILTDQSLPWLRKPWADGVTGADATPWLALIVLRGVETTAVGRRTVELGSLDPEPGEAHDAKVELLSLPESMAQDVLPTAADLRFLAHVREAAGGERQAVVVANRLPLRNATNEVHLVAMAGRYPSSGSPADLGPVELPTLAYWTFDSDDEGPGFREQALALAHSIGPLRALSSGAAEPYLRRGVIAVDSDDTVAFYRGPLLPASNDPVGATVADSFDEDVPQRPQQLVVHDRALGLDDLSFATAFALGRSLMIANAELAQSIDRWRRARRRQEHLRSQLGGMAAHRHGGELPLPADAVQWFDALLTRLEPIPDRYLLPDPELLVPAEPPTSWTFDGETHTIKGRLSFFTVDPVWVALVATAAVQVGAITERERRGHEFSIEPRPLRGFAVRSDLVQREDLKIHVLETDDTGVEVRLPLVERKLGADLALVMVASDAERFTVELGTEPHGLHFGVEDVVGAMHKVFRADPKPVENSGEPAGASPPTPEEGEEISVPLRKGADGTIDVAALAGSLAADSSAVFAYRMIVGAPTIRFELTIDEGS